MPLDKVKDLLKGVADKGANLTQDMSAWYNNLNPDVQKAITRGLAGAAAGGVAGHFLGSGRDRDRTRISPALMGMLAGSGASIAIPAGLKMLGGESVFTEEPRAPISRAPARVIDKGMGFAIKNPGKLALPGLAAWYGGAAQPYKLWWHGAKTKAKEGGGLYARKATHQTAVGNTTAELLKRIVTGGKGGAGDPGRREALRALGVKHLMPGGGLKITADEARKARLHRRLVMALRSKKLWKDPRGAVNMKVLGDHLANSKKTKVIPKGKRGLLLLPAALAAGYIGDKYWQGDW